MMISRDNEGKGNEFLLSKEHITHSDRSDDPRCENAQPDAFES